MSDTVFLGRNGQQLGPYTRAQLSAMAAQGDVAADDLAWHAGLSAWQPAAAVLASLGISSGAGMPPPLNIAAPAAAPGQMSRREMYEAFIGPEKSGYYVPVFEHFDAGRGSTWWNWPAALITQFWMLYRGMFLWGFLWYPILSWLVSGTISYVFTKAIGQTGTLLAYLLELIGSVLVMGFYSNKIYHSHVLKLIRRSEALRLSSQQQREWLIRKGATSYLWIVIVVFFGVAIIGILAAIAIPAYQDYTIRAQVSEGPELAAQARTAVAEYHRDKSSYPADNAAAGLPAPAEIKGQYVKQVQVMNGSIEITFGGAANPHIAGKVLVYMPEEAAGGRLLWHCNTPATDLPNKYLPPICRK